MKKKFRNLIYGLFLGFLILLPQAAGAVKTEFDTDTTETTGVADYVSKIMAWLLPIIGGIAVLMMIYAGYLYITSQGNPDSIGKAKDIIIGTITGLVLLLLIKLLLNQIGVK